MYSQQTFEDHNLFNYGIANVSESSVYYCDTAASDEKSNNKLFNLTNFADTLTSNPSNSTALGSHENEIETPQLEDYARINWERGISAVLMQVEDAQAIVDMDLTPEYLPVKCERTAVCDAHMFSTTASTSSPPETGEETSKSDSSEESDYNGNDGGMEVEYEVKTKPDQSKYKNKAKELFEKSLKMYNVIKALTDAEHMEILRENMKSNEQWAVEGQNLEQTLRRFEMLAGSENKKEVNESKDIKRVLLRELESKQYCSLAELYNFKNELLALESEVLTNFNKGFKAKVSHSFFKKNEFKSEDLFSWMLLVQIALVLLPEDSEYVELLPLKKSTVSLTTWLLDSPMKQENKDLYRDSDVRSHLREVMTEIYNNLMQQASTKMDQGRHSLLQEISSALGTNFANLQRSPRRVARVVRARASPQYVDIDGGMTGKRGSSRAPMLKEEKTTKKVNKQRK